MPKKVFKFKGVDPKNFEDMKQTKKVKEMVEGDCFVDTNDHGKKEWRTVQKVKEFPNGGKQIDVVVMFDAEEGEGV